MTVFTFQKVADTKTGLPGQSKKGAIALNVTVDGTPLSFQHWNDKKLQEEMIKAALKEGHVVLSIASRVQEVAGGPFLTATPA